LLLLLAVAVSLASPCRRSHSPELIETMRTATQQSLLQTKLLDVDLSACYLRFK